MDGFQSINPIDNKFKLGKKWFWIGIVIGALNVVAGVIYGIALIIEKEHRREGLIIAVFSLVFISLIIWFIGPLFMDNDFIPKTIK